MNITYDDIKLPENFTGNIHYRRHSKEDNEECSVYIHFKNSVITNVKMVGVKLEEGKNSEIIRKPFVIHPEIEEWDGSLWIRAPKRIFMEYYTYERKYVFETNPDLLLKPDTSIFVRQIT